MDFVNFTDMKGISQDFSDCGLHNDKYTKNSESDLNGRVIVIRVWQSTQQTAADIPLAVNQSV